jgi:phospholipid/cholesterol/gamma-HCH transport system permease protein
MSSNSLTESEIFVKSSSKDLVEIQIIGSLDPVSVETLWTDTEVLIKETKPKNVIVDSSRLTNADTPGITYFIKLRDLAAGMGFNYELANLAPEYLKLVDLFENFENKPETEELVEENFISQIGRTTVEHIDEGYESVTFLGEVVIGFVRYFTNPKKIRFNDILITSEKLGVNAFFIIALINFLVGLVIAFQSAIPLAEYGGTIFVADLLVLSVFKELGPLMTAIVVNGRSSSAFAAEIGTMKVNEELDALTTMGIDKIRFLVMPKFIATLIMLPILTIFGILFAMIGGLVVMMSLGFPPITYLNEITYAASYKDLLAGLFKTIFFALIIAGVGCLEGLRTKSGATAVGDSTTNAVVKGIILIVVVDGIFGVVYYSLGI